MGIAGRFPWTARLLLAVTSLLVCLVICELAARVVLPPQRLVRFETNTLPDRPYGVVAEKTDVDFNEFSVFGPKGRRLAPNVRVSLPVGVRDQELVIIETNSLGLRYDELEAKEPEEFRVLVLGDSVTLGSEVHDPELYTRRAEHLVAGRSQRVRFVNGGVMSMDLSNTFYHMVEVIGPVEPDMVVIQLYLNDAMDADVFVVDKIPSWLGWSRLLVWAADRVEGWRQSRSFEVSGVDLDADAWARKFVLHQRQVYGEDWETFERMHPTSRDRAAKDYGLGWSPEAWREIEKIIDAAAAFCGERDIDFAVMLSPVDLQVYGANIDRVPQEHFEAMCRRLDLACLDLLPVLRNHRQTTGDKVLYDQCHYTPLAHSIVAGELVSWLDGEDLLPD